MKIKFMKNFFKTFWNSPSPRKTGEKTVLTPHQRMLSEFAEIDSEEFGSMGVKEGLSVILLKLIKDTKDLKTELEELKSKNIDFNKEL